MSGVILLSGRGPLTHVDLDTAPDDGRRYELIDGTLVVTPAPSWRHQRAVGRLHLLLSRACPDVLEVLMAPFDVALSSTTVMQPDLVLARKRDLTQRNLPVAPILAVEVLSPSTRMIDLTLKKATYEQAGCMSYWTVDPDQPSFTAWELRDGHYVEVAGASDLESCSLTRPPSCDCRTTRPRELNAAPTGATRSTTA